MSGAAGRPTLRHMATEERAVLITGTIGVGKTAVAVTAGELLEEHGVPHAIIDLDWLAWMWIPDAPDGLISDVLARNLEAIVPHLLAAGARKLILCRAVRDDGEIAALTGALAPIPLTVVRLTSPRERIVERLSQRDTGSVLETHLGESEAFDAQLDELTLPHLAVANDDRPLGDVAREVIQRSELI